MRLSIMTGGLTDRFGLERGYALIREAGFDAVDWNLNDFLDSRAISTGTYRGNILEKPVDTLLEHFAPELEIQRKNGITIAQAHAPLPPICLTTRSCSPICRPSTKTVCACAARWAASIW